MSDHSELLDMISAVLDAKKKRGGKKATERPGAEPAEINGIRIVDESTPKPVRVKKPVPLAEPSPPTTRKPPAAARPRSESPPPEVPKPSKALALKRNPTRPMPHSCNCPICPLKN